MRNDLHNDIISGFQLPPHSRPVIHMLSAPCRLSRVSSAGNSNNPFENLVRHDNRNLLMALIRALGRYHRQIILCYYFGGLTRRQIASKLNRSTDLVSLRLREGRATLRRLLNSHAGSHWLRHEFQEQFAPLAWGRKRPATRGRNKSGW